MEPIKSPFSNNMNKSQIHSQSTPFMNNNEKHSYNENNNNHLPPPSKTQKKETNTINKGKSYYQAYDNSIGYEVQEESNYESIIEEYKKIKQFNCETCFLNPTSNIFPSSLNVLKDSKFPVGLSISPLSSSYPSCNIPYINYESNDIPRCINNLCRAYLNPFVKFIEGGEKWICNFCKQVNRTDDYYYCKLDKDGLREDRFTKTELCCGTYEFEANEKYWKKNRTPNKSLFIIMIETSNSAIQSGYLLAIIESIKDVVNNEYFYNGKDTKIAIMTYDTCVSFYSCNEKMAQPQILCVSNEPVFLPTIKENLMLRAIEDKEKIISILDLIQNTYNNNPPSIKDSSKIISCLNGAYLLGKNLGAKIVIFSSSNSISSNPKFNANTTENLTKEDLAYSSRDKKQLGNMGINLTNDNMSIDLFVSAESPTILYTMNQLPEYSNGNIYLYKNFKIETHYKNLFNQIRRVLSREISWEGVLRTRFSHGYKINEFLTPVLITNQDLFVFPTCDSDQTYHIGLSLIDENSDVAKSNLSMKDKQIYIQSALLYSYGDGTRRIRIHNLCIPLSSNPKDIYLAGNSELISVHLMKAAIDKLYKSKSMNDSLISLENNFKSMILSNFRYMQKKKKELSDNLSLLPLYVLGMYKNRMFSKNELEKRLDVDLSNYLRIKFQRMEVNEAMSFILPKIFALHECYSDASIGSKNNETGEVVLPQLLGNSLSYLDENGLYLIDNGFMLIIFVRKSTPSNILTHLFGVEDIQFLAENPTEESVFEKMDGTKERIMNIIDSFRGYINILNI